MLICVCLRILASSRIPDMILGDKPLVSEVVLSQIAMKKIKTVTDLLAVADICIEASDART
jgi:hypothetical protein